MQNSRNLATRQWRHGKTWLATLLFSAGVVTYVVILGYWILATHQNWQALQVDEKATYKEKYDASLEASKAIWGGVGTVATIVGGVFLYLNYQNAQERLTTERFSKAVEQLGNEKIEVRLGGIYSLQHIAKDSPNYYWTVMEILCSFVREKSAQKNHPNSNPSFHTEQTKFIPLDALAALKVICYRDSQQDPTGEERIDLSRSHLSGAYIPKANLQRANLYRANLRGACLTEANLQGAFLKSADLRQTQLKGAKLSNTFLHKTNLIGAKDLDLNELHKAILCETLFESNQTFNRDCKVLESRGLHQ